MPFVVFGALLLLVAVVLVFSSARRKQKLGEMAATETASAEEVASLAKAVAAEIGAGSFARKVEAKGVIECERPLVSELAGIPCVRYAMRVTREWEETYWEKDDKGQNQRKTRRGSETVASNTRTVRFHVRDATGLIAVDPEGASFVDEQVFSRFESGERRGARMRFGQFDFAPDTFAALAGGRTTLGYRFEERAVTVGKQVYVLGEAVDRDGDLRIAKPSGKGESFIVSLKSEEQLSAGAASAVKGMRMGAAIAAAAAAASVVYGLLKG